MSIEDTVAALREVLASRAAIRHATTILQYDSETVMPRQAVAGYSETMGVLAEQDHRLLTAERTGELLHQLLEQREQAPFYLVREAEELSRRRDKLACVPLDEYGRFQRAVANAGQAWREAKQRKDFAAFRPHLEELVATSARFARYYDQQRPVYDILLEDYEPGLTTGQLDGFFDQVRSALVPLIRAIAQAPPPDTSFLRQEFPLEGQKQLSRYLMQVLTLDENRCALGQSEHPFSTAANNRDVRITSHYYPDNLLSSLYSVIHEGGHALYMLHMADEINGLQLSEGASCAIHESQSRLFENMIGRSQPFINAIFPRLQALFPQQLAQVEAEQFYRACNLSRPSLIRIEADELTYPLHVLVRYQLEKQLFSGDLAVADLPEAWNRLYREYLGVEPADDSQGVLQDTHWSGASFGYFPTYALGSAYAAQITAQIEREIDLWGAVAAGELRPLVDWLTEKVFRHGGIKTPSQLIHEVCGHGFDPGYYTAYLRRKYGDLYGLTD